MGVSGIILAAGGSARLGRPKQFLLLDGEPIIRIVVRNAIESDLAEVILVTGAHADDVVAAVGELGQVTIYNPDFATGQSA
jgi:CTP:molybdopterin cytidylyltransferase MocA